MDYKVNDVTPTDTLR